MCWETTLLLLCNLGQIFVWNLRYYWSCPTSTWLGQRRSLTQTSPLLWQTRSQIWFSYTYESSLLSSPEVLVHSSFGSRRWLPTTIKLWEITAKAPSLRILVISIANVTDLSGCPSVRWDRACSLLVVVWTDDWRPLLDWFWGFRSQTSD